MLYFVGLGLGDEKDITVRGLEVVRSCDRIYLDAYTSILGVDKERLEAFYGKSVTLADRETVESAAHLILDNAGSDNVAFLVVGDPFGATTHTDLYLRAVSQGIPVEVLHNASIINAVGSCGLQLYSFGNIITIPFFTATWRPDSPYLRLEDNWRAGLHTLCLLDIKVKEQSDENLLRGRKIYEPPRYMTVQQAVAQLLECEARHAKGICSRDVLGVGMMRIGTTTQKIVVGTLGELMEAESGVFGDPLHSFILPGRDLHELEYQMLQLNALPTSILSTMSYADFMARQK